MMPKIYKFTYGGTIASYPKSIPTYHVLGCADNIQGEFVTLESYQTQAAEIAKLNATIERMADRMATMGSELVKADDEIAKLRGLLKRWQKAHYTPITALTLGSDTNEALK